jgi:Bacterial Ig-like domain (group 2)/Glucodextranase, domain B
MNFTHVDHAASLLSNGQVLITGVGGTPTGGVPTCELYQPTNLTTPPNLIALAVSPPNSSIISGTSSPFTATGVFADGTATDMTSIVGWSSSVPTIATISSAGSATGGSTGTTTITATSGSVSASTPLSVIAVQLTSISINPNLSSIVLGANQQFSATGWYNDGSWKDLTSSVTWSSSAPSIASISATGLATGVGVGETTIQATLGSVQSATYFSVAATLQSLSINPGSAQLSIGSIVQLQAIGTYSNGNTTVTTLSVWSSSDTNVATVSGGLVRSLASGTATITATYGWYGTNLSSSILVTVTNQYAPPQISAAVYPSSYGTGWTHQNTTVTFTCTPGGLPIASCTSPQTITTEGQNQVVTGTATDTAGTSVSTSVTLNIDKTPPTLTLTAPSDGMTFTSSQLSVSGTVTDNFTQYPPATCNGNTAVMSGNSFSCNIWLNVGVNTVVVTASDQAGNVSSVVLHEFLTGTWGAPTSLQITPIGVNMPVGGTQQFTAVDDMGRLRSDATWTVDNTNLGTMTSGSPATLTALAAGTVTLTATVQGISAQTQVNILALVSFSPGTVLWSAPSVPGYSPSQIVQAVPSSYGPSLYSLAKSSDGKLTSVQALTSDGQQLWQTTVSTLIGNPVADAFGGTILIQACDPSDPLYHPLTFVDLDGATGTEMWQGSIPSLVMGNTAYCPAGAPKMAIRQDGAVVVAMPLEVSPPLVVLDGVSGQQILTPPIPPSTLTGNIQSASCDCFSPVGQPMVDSDGTINVEYAVRQINTNSPAPISAALSLLKIAPNGSTSTTQLGSSNVANLWPGQIIPGGQGGVLATWVNDPVNPPAALHPYQAADVTGGVATNFNMPMAPQNYARDPNTSLPLDLPLVQGENGTAFVSYGSNATSFNVNGGSANWNYPAAQQSAVAIDSSASGNGLLAKLTDQTGMDTPIYFDNSGAQTLANYSGHSLQSGVGPHWFGVLDNSVQTILSWAVALPNSTWTSPNQKSTNSATRKIKLTVLKITEDNLADSFVQARVKTATDYWTALGLVFDWDGTVTPTPACDPTLTGCNPLSDQYLARVQSDAELAEVYRRFVYDPNGNQGQGQVKLSPKGITVLFVYLLKCGTGGDGVAAYTLPNTVLPLVGRGYTLNFVLAASGSCETGYAPTSDDVLDHEFGHAFQLQHVGTNLASFLDFFFEPGLPSSKINPSTDLMCGPTGQDDWASVWINECLPSRLTRYLTDAEWRSAVGWGNWVLGGQPQN